MRKTRLLTLLVLLMAVVTGAWAQEVVPVTLDFTTNSWGFPAGSEEKTAAENSYTSGGYTITLCGSSGNGYYFSPTEPYILLGKQGAYLQLPAFSSAVDSIKVVGSPNASTSVEQNIYVDDNNSWVAVSTQTTGMKNVTQKYVIDENYRAAGNIYVIKVDNNYNTQIKKVLVYFTPASGYTVSLKDGVKDADKWTVKVGEGEAQAFPVEGLLGGETVTVTYSGTREVKSVKAEKKAATVPVTAITLNKTETSIKVGSTETLSVTSVLPEEATDKTYTWKTSDETKATVDQDGKVTAVAAGTVTIYAEANDGSGVKGNCSVTVTPATITVTWNNNDITGSGYSFTKDGVTITAGNIDFMGKNFMHGGTFTTTLGNFTKIEVTAGDVGMLSGAGWSGNYAKKTWTGTPASSVSFSGDIIGMGMGNTKFVFTIE